MDEDVLDSKFFLYIYNLKEEIKKSITAYTSNKYNEINNYLENNRLSRNSDFDILINDIDIAFAEAPVLDVDIKVYRGMNMSVPKNMRYRSKNPLFGYKGLYKGFISTSIDPIGMFSGGPGGILLEINLKRGQPILAIKMISEVSEENEILLPRNSVIKIIKFHLNRIECEVESKLSVPISKPISKPILVAKKW